MKLLWLCSWYPNPVNPYEGDFVQRHAQAISAFTKLTVFYVAQLGEKKNIEGNKILKRQNGDVSEEIIFFRFKRTGLDILDRFRYNMRYFRVYKKKIRDYVKENGRPDLIHVHIPMKAGIIARWIKRRWGIPYIVSEHSSHYNRDTEDSFFKKNIFHRQVIKKIFRDAAAVTNVSDTTGKILKDLFQLLEVKVIHNVVDGHFFYFKKSQPLKFRFIHVSSFGYQKNAEGIIRAAAKLAAERRDFELVIVGPAPAELMDMVKQMNLQSVISFTGEISYAEVAKQMQEASAFVLFSRYENFPCVMEEALCCGLPFIGTDVGGIAEAVNNSNGFIVPSGNEGELKQAMNDMIVQYRQFDREKIAEAAANRFNYFVIGKAFNDLYRSVTAANKPPAAD